MRCKSHTELWPVNGIQVVKNDKAKNHFTLPRFMFQQQSNPTRIPPQVSQSEDNGQAVKAGNETQATLNTAQCTPKTVLGDSCESQRHNTNNLNHSTSLALRLLAFRLARYATRSRNSRLDISFVRSAGMEEIPLRLATISSSKIRTCPPSF